MEEVAASIVSQPTLSGRFCGSYQMAKKRSLPSLHTSSSYLNQDSSDNWNPISWNWDSSRFIAKQIQSDGPHVGNGLQIQPRKPEVDDDENLRLDLGAGNSNNGGMNLGDPQQGPVSRPNKKVKSGSPGGVNYPVCQVDDCKEDLSAAKDYHRRHKVCEVHSKATKALVGKQMQRFCQQCSRFHPLSEFDEGKRSCRRRLAGHNRRRRKTQHEDTNPRVVVPINQVNNVANSDIVKLLAVLTHSQATGNTEDKNGKISSLPDKDQLIQILSKINSPNGSISNIASSGKQYQTNGNSSSPSTKDLLASLSATQSQQSTEGSDSEKRSSPSYHSTIEEVQETSTTLPLQLFSPSPEYYSNPSEDRSPPMSSPPVVHDLFPMRTSRETMKDDRFSHSEGEVVCLKENGTFLQLFGSTQATENGSIQSSPYRAGYASSSGSHPSSSSPNPDTQDRTGRIIFKLFDKDPSHLPGSLRTQIYSWLSNSPSEMESYIRPGCIVLTLYLSMPSFAWDQLEENFLNYVKSLVKDIDADFWGSGRFLVHTDRQMASRSDGKIRLCKSWRGLSAPELISVTPVAVVGGEETSVLLRGRSLNSPGTKIHCTHAAEYDIKEIPLSLCQDTAHNEINLGSFKVNGALGRCFIEVENDFRGTSFPLIIADKTICQELNLLESEINGTTVISREEVLRFLDELGWLFQRKSNSSLFEIPDYRLNRFKFLLIFSVERDFCALVKTLLDILLELNLGRKGLEMESLEMLSEIHLLNRAVKRRCRSMVDLLINYSIIDSTDNSQKYIFVPNMAGPGGVTPLHLAASTSSSDDMVDSLTRDPQKIGLNSWNSVLDANGLSPYAYALMRNNHSYNTLVAQKLGDSKNGQVSISIKNEIEQFQIENSNKTVPQSNQTQKSCSKCAAVAARGYGKRYPGSKGLLQRPYIHSMLLVAAVCVCVCVFLRGHPYVGCVSPFSWENLGYGAT